LRPLHKGRITPTTLEATHLVIFSVDKLLTNQNACDAGVFNDGRICHQQSAFLKNARVFA
jgi:hypothetical protein